MISHSPGTTGVQQAPSERQCEVAETPVGFEVGRAVCGECIQTIEPAEHRRRRGSGVRRVQKHDVEPHPGRRCPGERICTHDFHIVRSESADRMLERRGDTPIVLHHDDILRSTRGRLDPECSGAGEEVETARTFDRSPEPVEQGFAYTVRGGTKPPGGEHRQHPAAPTTGDDAHGAPGFRTFHAAGDMAGRGLGRARPDWARATIVHPSMIHPPARIPLHETRLRVFLRQRMAYSSLREIPPTVPDH